LATGLPGHDGPAHKAFQPEAETGEPPRRSTTAPILASSGMVRCGRGSERWPVRWGPDLVTGEGGGSPEGGFHGGVARPEGKGGEGRHPMVEVGGSWFGVASTECVDGRRRLGSGR
jgi:hypothetical protein